jgi:hypothetical protein
VGTIETTQLEEKMSLYPNTGDDKMDKAYVNMQEHVKKCKTFDEFEMYFSYVVKTDDPLKLNRWLLKVLFVNMKQDPDAKHDFDVLLEAVGEEKAAELRAWLQSNLEKFS